MKVLSPQCCQKLSNIPCITIFAAAMSSLLYFYSDISTTLQYDHALIASGELWRVITGHWTHWTFEHFLWCTITFVALGSICEQNNRRWFLFSLSAAVFIIPLVSWFVSPEMVVYRGLSGICSSVFVTGALLMIKTSMAEKNWVNVILPTAGGLIFFVKILYEFISGQALFVKSIEMFTPVPLVHLVGGCVGLISVILKFSMHR